MSSLTISDTQNEKEKHQQQEENTKTTPSGMSPVLAILEYVETLRESHESLMKRIRSTREKTEGNLKLKEEIQAKRVETERRVSKKKVELAKMTSSLQTQTRCLRLGQDEFNNTEKSHKKTKSQVETLKSLRTELRNVMLNIADIEISNRHSQASIEVVKRTRDQHQSELDDLIRVRDKFQFSLKKTRKEISSIKEETDFVMQCSGALS
jgi:hypothetical protein